jgi:hypothetical protein
MGKTRGQRLNRGDNFLTFVGHHLDATGKHTQGPQRLHQEARVFVFHLA